MISSYKSEKGYNFPQMKMKRVIRNRKELSGRGALKRELSNSQNVEHDSAF
jgi:hypothetical protein